MHLYDRARGVTPLFSGVREIGDGSAQGARHLGIDWKRIRNRPMDVRLPEPLAQNAREAQIGALLYTDYPECDGRNAFPFHTKARALIRALVDPARLRAIDMTQPLQSAIDFEAPEPARARIETRLRDLVAADEHLYLIGPGGHSSAAKVWPQDRAQDLVRLLPSFDARARSLIVDEPTLRAAFGDLDVPFAHLLVTLLARAHAYVGVPAGPLHAALAMRRSPVVGIWLAHHPDWYDEPNAASLHLTGPLVHRKRFEDRKATRTAPATWRARTIAFPSKIPNASDAIAALELLR